VFILKQLRLPPLIIFYGARLFTLFIWIFFMHQLIKSLKYYRWLMTFLVLLPMTLFVSIGISADVMTNLWAFGFMGFILNQMHLNRLWTYRDFLWASLFVFMLASAKLVYMLLIFLFLLIPVRRFSRPNSVWLSFGALLLMGMTVAIFWAKSITTTYIPYDQYNLAFRNFLDLPRCANMHDQFNYLTSHHLYAGKVFINSLVETFPMYYSGYIGTFGWLDTKLPDWSIHLSYAILFLFALVGNHGHIFKWQQRIILLVTACITTMALLMSQLLSWECVGSDVIKTIQGRYFIPIFPLLFLAISGVFKIPGTQKRWSKVTLLYLVIILTISTIVIYKRYYVPAQYQIDEIYCDVETQKQNKLVTSQPDIYLDNADQRSNDFAHSGQFALKLNAEHPYGFTFRTTGGHYGDMIEVEVWRLGNTGSIVIVGDGGKAFYAGTNESRFEKDGDWNKLTYRYTLEEELPDKEIAVYIFNKSETSYFDDITIRIMRRKNTWGI
ncbi:MAG: DUF2142 domain-containing protein, partial [Saprospiraceae bacterium]|nr:DUF2142 domain-containing protein [Saprospiraceae bacterium]